MVLAIVSIILWITVPIGIFIARHWIIARVSKGVEHHFDRQIEELRTRLRKSEEQYKSELRDREADIATLRNAVLAGSAGRQALLDKRRFEAAEKIWTAVNDLAQLKSLSQTMAILNYKAVAKKANDPKMQDYLSIVGAGAPEQINNVARDEQPFVTDLAWAYFMAYRSILYMNHARFMMLKNAIDDSDYDPEKYFSTDNLRNTLKAVLPHQSKFIDENDPSAFHYLLDEIERYLLVELRNTLEGKEADQMAATRAKEIMDAVKKDEQAANETSLRSQGLAR